ncbi:MAG: MFS transporter [Dehalococcoidia bacterium]
MSHTSSDHSWFHRQPTLLPGRAIPAAHLYRLRAVGFGFFMWLTFGMYALYVVRDAGLTPFQLLVAGAVLEFTVVAFEIPTGILADAVSRRLSVILGSFIVGVGWAVMGLFPSFEGILAGEFLWGFGFTFISGANDAWLADEIGEERAAKIYPQAAQWRQAAIVAGVLSAALLAFIDLRLPFIIGGVGGIALGAFLAMTMTEAGWQPTPREGRSSWATARQIAIDAFEAARIRPMVRAAVAIRLMVGAASEVFYRLYGYHLLEDIGMPEGTDEVVLFGAIGVAAQLGSFGVIALGRRASADGSRASAARVLWVLYLVYLLGPLAFAFAPTAPIAIGLAVATLWAASAEPPFFVMWVNRGLDSRTRATVLSGTGQADSLGQTVSALGFGALATATSVRTALALAAGFAAPALALVRTKPLEERERAEEAAVPGD